MEVTSWQHIVRLLSLLPSWRFGLSHSAVPLKTTWRRSKLRALNGVRISEMNHEPLLKRNYLAFLPVVFFLSLAAIFASQLMSGKDASVLPSALIGKSAPATDLPSLNPSALNGLKSAAFTGHVTVLNVFASWCIPCRQEHPALIKLAKDKRFILAGLNYKDRPENAKRFIAELGDPYAIIGTDEAGRAGIEWGVYGVPETYVIDKDGIIRYKYVGPLDDKAIVLEILPEIEKALAGS
jgi:cytochrome c biogenesis protein CcmG, thiol:disulfide interchange protein DsbE